MKHALLLASAMGATTLMATVPTIDQSSVSARQDGGKFVVISYTMNPAAPGDNEPAIVTVDVQTNYVENAETKWASIGGEHLTTLSGDVNKIVQHTTDRKHRILWNPTAEGLPETEIAAGNVRVEITAWATNSPPAYWVIDLTQPTDRLADRYYPNAGQIPLTITNILYKTERLVFRRIPAKGVTWKMGNAAAGASAMHYVTLSYDYWMAVFETTIGQMTRLQWNAASPDTDVEGATGDAIPFAIADYGNASYGRCLRRTQENDKTWLDPIWPEVGHETIPDKCIIYKIRQGLGGMLVDLPTEAEWEFAARAGSSTKYCNGGESEADLARVAWYSGNAENNRHDVGLKDANGWGLYDVLGNVYEWTLDWYRGKETTPVWDPVGPKRTDQWVDPGHIIRGGSGKTNLALEYMELGRVECGFWDGAFGGNKWYGFRLCLVMP